jgi:hypothetical protein
MAKPTRRPAGQLVGGLLLGALGAIFWVASRQRSAPTEPPSPPITPHMHGRQPLGAPQLGLRCGRS